MGKRTMKVRIASDKAPTPATAIALYHVMKASDGFDETAQALFQLVRMAARQYRAQRRVLFLDVEGHRNPAGGFDNAAFEIINDFTLGTLKQWLSEVHTPLLHAVTTQPQSEDVPDHLEITA